MWRVCHDYRMWFYHVLALKRCVHLSKEKKCEALSFLLSSHLFEALSTRGVLHAQDNNHISLGTSQQQSIQSLDCGDRDIILCEPMQQGLHHVHSLHLTDVGNFPGCNCATEGHDGWDLYSKSLPPSNSKAIYYLPELDFRCLSQHYIYIYLYRYLPYIWWNKYMDVIYRDLCTWYL